MKKKHWKACQELAGSLAKQLGKEGIPCKQVAYKSHDGKKGLEFCLLDAEGFIQSVYRTGLMGSHRKMEEKIASIGRRIRYDCSGDAGWQACRRMAEEITEMLLSAGVRSCYAQSEDYEGKWGMCINILDSEGIIIMSYKTGHCRTHEELAEKLRQVGASLLGRAQAEAQAAPSCENILAIKSTHGAVTETGVYAVMTKEPATKAMLAEQLKAINQELSGTEAMGFPCYLDALVSKTAEAYGWEVAKQPADVELFQDWAG